MNRLAGEPSAYLRQHALNPLAWQPFDDAAFAEAVARDVPIFLSVGYAACHWCHVMATESFEDPTVGSYLNSHFVAIKVDREERPDVDDAYMAATQALSGQGGWPMSVFLTPSGLAFYAGTYFGPEPGPGRPSFREVLAAVHEAWVERRELVEETANDLATTLAKPLWQVRTEAVVAGPDTASGPDIASGKESAAGLVSPAVELYGSQGPDWAAAADLAVTAMIGAEDAQYGGFGRAPKFPPTPGLAFLLRHAASGRDSAGAGQTSAVAARQVAGRTLGAMVHSALFDRLGGGFARYSVTADWSEPHYEKMLYDNAGLLQALVQWVRLADDGGTPTGDIAPLSGEDARDAADATVAWLLAEMRLPGGAFASSLDADTVIDGVHYEGASYRWTQAELASAVSAHGAPAAPNALTTAEVAEVAAMMGVDAEGSHPLHPGRSLTGAQKLQWERIKPALLGARAKRVMPARDDKVVAGWNGTLMGALAEGAMVLGKPDWLAAAVELGNYLQQVHWDGQLYRVSHAGRARGIKGLLEDYAACAQGYLALYAATGESQWFEFAGDLLRTAEQDFIVDGVVLNHDSSGGPAGGLQGSRFADPFDNATASGVALFAGALTSWAAYTGSAKHRKLAEHILAGVPELAQRAPRSAGGLLAVAEAHLAGPLEVAIVGPDGAERSALLRVAWAAASPGMVIADWDGLGAAPVPLLEGRSLAERPEERRAGTGLGAVFADSGTVSGDAGVVSAGSGVTPLAYVCRNMSCARPVSTPEELAGVLLRG